MSFNFFHFRDRWTLFSNLWQIQFHKVSLFCLTVPFVGSDPITFLAITAVETARWLRRFIIWNLISLLAILVYQELKLWQSIAFIVTFSNSYLSKPWRFYPSAILRLSCFETERLFFFRLLTVWTVTIIHSVPHSVNQAFRGQCYRACILWTVFLCSFK